MARVKTAVLVLAPALLVVLIAVIVSTATLADLPGDPGVETGLARVGNDFALVIVTDGTDAEAARARSLIANWGLLAPALALVVSAGVAWWVSGRVHRRVDDAAAAIDAADAERESRLQEVVHELRTPLAVMGTNLELAALESRDASGGYVEAARRAVDRMARTVDDLDGHGRLAIEQHEGPVDLAALAESVGSEHVGPGRARGVHVLARGAGTVLVPSVDPGAVRAALGNFLSNAVRLAPAGSAVVVDWGTEGDWAWVAVIDSGPGLPGHFHSRCFERGWQGPHDRDRNRGGGSGLGLTIARQLTEAQGGVVTVDSEEGGGATFTMWIPLTREAETGAVLASDGVHSVSSPWMEQLAGA